MKVILFLLIFVVLFFVGIQESFAMDTGNDYQILLSDVEGNTSFPESLGKESFIAFHSRTSFNNQGNPIEAEIRIVCGPNNIQLYNETKLFTISNPRTMIDSFTPTFSGHYTITIMAEEIPPISTMFTISGNPDNHCDSEFIKNLPPLKQISAGIFSENVICKEGFKQIFKSSDNSPACVKPETATKLIDRGWAITKAIEEHGDDLEKIWVEIEATQCADPWYNELISFYQENEEYKEGPNQIIKNYYEKLGVTIYDITKEDRFQGNVICEACFCSDGFTWLFLIPTSEIPKMLDMGFKIS